MEFTVHAVGGGATFFSFFSREELNPSLTLTSIFCNVPYFERRFATCTADTPNIQTLNRRGEYYHYF